jgi:hypothetical protein
MPDLCNGRKEKPLSLRRKDYDSPNLIVKNQDID